MPTPELFGGHVLSLSAAPVSNYEGNLSFCNVTILYTHPGQNDEINVFVWLPLEGWNERFLGSGGGGYRMREGNDHLASNLADGYAVVATDGGHDWTVASAESWALLSPGNINAYLLNNWAAVALEDAAILGKAITTSFYGQEPRFSYWSGCSTGGRQGLMLAQRFPGLYDGILATAPAINWAKFIVAEYWPQFVMNQLGTYPTPCELDAITSAVIKACDGLDGVEDGIISHPQKCDFDAAPIVGREYSCGDVTGTISEEATVIAKKAWLGPRTEDGDFTWYGLGLDAPLSGLVNTSCSGKDCIGVPFFIAEEWIKYWVKRNPDFDMTNISHSEYDSIFHRSFNQYNSIIGTDDPNLSEFKQAGGKMITWHGGADELIFPQGTTQYYDNVLELDHRAGDFYRYFVAPGVGHCSGGVGPAPFKELDALVAWVEGGVVPETLAASIVLPGTNITRQQNLCAYPLVSAYQGGDHMEASSFECRETFK